jgi:hypothetical protein
LPSKPPGCPSRPRFFHRRSGRLRLLPSQNAPWRWESRPWPSNVYPTNRPADDHLVFGGKHILDNRLAIREKAWTHSGDGSCSFQAARPIREVWGVEGKFDEHTSSIALVFPPRSSEKSRSNAALFSYARIVYLHCDRFLAGLNGPRQRKAARIRHCSGNHL